MKRAWETVKRRWEEDPLTTAYMALGIGMTLYSLARDLEDRHHHAQIHQQFESRRFNL